MISDSNGAAPLRVGVVGCGDISTMHFDAITADPKAALVAVADVDLDAATAASAHHGGNAYTELDAMLDRERLDVLHVCTPHYVHAPMAIAALRRGVHVLLEKPVATTVADAAAVVEAAAAGSAMVGVCFQNRYNSTARRIRALLDSGALGPVLGGRASVTWYRDAGYYLRRPWRGTWAQAGGGVLINQAIHTLDLLQWYLGDVVEVFGQAGQLALQDVIEVEDSATLRLIHDGGAVSLFLASNGYGENAPITLELRTERARLRLDGDLRIEWADGHVEVVNETVLSSGERAYWGASHGLLINDFYAHVRSRRHFWIDAAEAMKTLRILTAVYAQSGLGRQPVV